MTQLLQNIDIVLPYFFLLGLLAVTSTGIWLIFQLKKSNHHEQFSISDRLFIKRNAARLRKLQLH